MVDCVYEGSSYSDGSLVCQAGIKMRCNGGVWEDTGLTCPEDGREQDFTVAVSAETDIPGEELKSEKYKVSDNIKCSWFVQNLTYQISLANRCKNRIQTVVNSYDRHGEIIRTAVYHLKGYMARPFDSGSFQSLIMSEGDWSAGAPGGKYLSVRISDIDGQKLWTAKNGHSKYYLAISFAVMLNGKKWGDVWDVIAPGQTSRLYAFLPGEVGYLTETFCAIDNEGII